MKKSEAKEPFSFSFVDDAGKSIVKSENYSAKKSAVNGVESVKKNSQELARYDLKESKNGKFFFNIKATNGQVVATSALFPSEIDRENAIALLKQNGASAATIIKIVVQFSTLLRL
ncbi:MAG: YegP family protein [Candidatus Sedimenticola sp. (ex Thyasira tokunagai)]